MRKFIPLSVPNFEGNERKYVDDAIDQGWVSTGGAYITKLEEEMANEEVGAMPVSNKENLAPVPAEKNKDENDLNAFLA